MEYPSEGLARKALPVSDAQSFLHHAAACVDADAVSKDGSSNAAERGDDLPFSKELIKSHFQHTSSHNSVRNFRQAAPVCVSVLFILSLRSKV